MSTPTGSTAYSLSTGGCIIHPDVNAVAINAINPRTLSFRGLVLPADTMDFTEKIALDSRADAIVSVDGVTINNLLKSGDEINVKWSSVYLSNIMKIKKSKYDAFTVEKISSDWSGRLNKLLHWNQYFER